MQVTKTVRLTAGADTIEEAIATALGRAAETTAGITSFKIVEVGGTVDEAGVPAQFQVTVDVTFTVRESAVRH